jgi:hypothetical protein
VDTSNTNISEDAGIHTNINLHSTHITAKEKRKENTCVKRTQNRPTNCFTSFECLKSAISFSI